MPPTLKRVEDRRYRATLLLRLCHVDGKLWRLQVRVRHVQWCTLYLSRPGGG